MTLNKIKRLFVSRAGTRSAIALAIAGIGTSAEAGFNQYSIGLNFGSDEPTGQGLGTLAAPDMAGVPAVAQPNWNNLSLLSGTAENIIVDNAGALTGVGVVWSSANTWSSWGRGTEANGTNLLTGTPHNLLFLGYLDTGSSSTTAVTITNIPSQLTSAGYDVYVYGLSGVGGRGGSYRIVNAADSTELRPYLLGTSATNPTNYIQDIGTAHTNEAGNYLVFRGLTAPGIIVEATTTVNAFSGTPRAPIAAVQLVTASTAGEAQAATGLNLATNAGPGNLAVTFTPGAGSSGSLVVVRAGRPVTAQPVDGVTYAANTAFGQGTNLGDDDPADPASANYVVYDGNGSSVTVTGLDPTQLYHVAVYSYTGSGGSRNYTLLNPARGSASVLNPVTGITLSVPSPVVAGGTRRVSAIATFANGATADVTTSATYTSAAPSIVSFPANNPAHLAALTNGSTAVWASYQGLQSTQMVTVVSGAMTHRYTFNEAVAGATNFADSVGDADGFAVVDPPGLGGPDGAGQLILNGLPNNYAVLPPNLLTNYGAASFELWFTDDSGSGISWARLLDFNSGTSRYLFISPTAAGNTVLRGTINAGAGEAFVSGQMPTPGTEQHIAWTIEPARGIQRIFLNGVQVGITTNAVISPEDVGPTTNNWFGRSAFAADSPFAGRLNEVRVYNSALSPLQIALNAVTGPEVINNNPGALTSLNVSLTNSLRVTDTAQVRVTGTFANVSGTVELTSASETTYSSSASGVATVNAGGLVTAVGPGSATIRAAAFGVTNSVVVSVVDVPLSLTHRYSFNGNYNDSVGGAHGTPGGLATFDAENRRLVLNGNGDHVALPSDLIADYNSITIETWYREVTTLNWSRVWDFGGQDAAGTAGNRYLFLSGRAGNQTTLRAALRSVAVGEQVVNAGAPSQFTERHVVYTLDAASRVAYLYVDGVPVARNANVTLQPRDMGTVPNMWIGRSQFSGDTYFVGTMNELRIWRGALTPRQVALSFAAGPDLVTTNLTGFASVTVTNMTVGTVQPARLGFGGGVTIGAPLSGSMFGVVSNWSSSNPMVADVDDRGVVTAVGAGTATISATHNGVTQTSATVTVSAGGPTLTHRYSFTTDANDSVGGAHGANGGAATFSGGSVFLDGSASSYISLPGGLFTNDNVTFEIWMTYSNNIAANARAWDFGDSTTTNYFYFSPSDAANPAATAGSTVFRYNYGDRGNQERTLAKHGRALSNGTNKIHYVWVLNRAASKADFYINGVLEETYPYERLVNSEPLVSSLKFTEGYIGRASRLNSPPAANLVGSVDEFRIWDGALNKQEVQSSYLLGPDAANPLAAGALQSISVVLPDSVMIQGAAQRPIVRGTFATAGTIDLTRTPGLGLSSGNSAVVAVDGDLLKAIAPGTAQVTASYGGQTANASVTVTAKQLRLMHRYSFANDARDSVGNAHGVLRGNARVETNHVVLDGSIAPNTFVELPSQLISGFDVVTFEGFLTTGNSGNQGRLFDFGDRANVSNQDTGREYIFMSPVGNNGTSPRVAVRPDPGMPGLEQGVTLNADLRNVRTHIVTVIDSTSNTITIYTNGVFGGSVTNSLINLAGLTDNFNYLGRAVWNDPHLTGAIDEFRVYYGAMSGSQVAASFAAGANPEQLTAARVGSNVVISWPALPLLTGYRLQFATSLTLGDWSDAGAATLVGDTYQFTVPTTAPQLFFRLIR